MPKPNVQILVAVEGDANFETHELEAQLVNIIGNQLQLMGIQVERQRLSPANYTLDARAVTTLSLQQQFTVTFPYPKLEN